MFLEVTTDPVKLWSAPSSESYEQLQFYNDHFMPFYRVEQIFIKTYDTKGEVHTTPPFMTETSFGPVFNRSIMEEVRNYISTSHLIF